MQTHFTTDMAAHVWAQQRQASGSGGKGSVFFEGPALYSYGSHFLTGYIADGAALLNADSYSVTTSRHQSDARHATRHMTQVSVPALTELRDALAWRESNRSRGKAIVRKWARDHAKEIAGAADYWAAENQRGRAAAEFVGSLFGLTKANIGAELKRGLAADAKAERETKARERRQFVTLAKSWADADQATFDQWAHTYRHIFEPLSFSYVATMEKSVAKFARELTNGARLGAKVIGARRVAVIKARRLALLQWAEGLGARAIETDRAAARATFAAWSAQWVAAEGDMAAQFAAMRGAPPSWRYHDSGRATVITDAELRQLQSAEQWARDHEGERVALAKAIAEREAQQRRERDAAQFAQWQAGASVQCPASYRTSPDGGAYVRRRGDELETSQGASVPWSHALRVFRFVKLCRERGEGWRTNGRVVRVGHFQVSEITAEGDFRAGCHYFAWPQIAALADAQGVLDAEASADAVEARD